MTENSLNKIISFNKNNKNIEFLNIDAKIILDKYKDDPKCFLFLDPPYISNNLYMSKTNNDFLFDFLKKKLFLFLFQPYNYYIEFNFYKIYFVN